MEVTPVKKLLTLLILLPASLFGAPGVTSRPYGTCPEGPVEIHTLTNANGLSVSIMDYGATVVSVVTPDRFGRMADIALGFDSPAAYAAAALNFGTMGRYINRIGGGELTLDGHTYELTKNKPPNTMHGGKLGFNRHLWKSEVVTQNPASIKFSRVSPDGEEGFPGRLNVSVTFTLYNDNRWAVHYEATTDKTTVVNLSNHTLFNLSGAGNGTILDDIVKLHAGAITPIDATSVPTGEIKPVDGTPYDLRQPTVIGSRINDLGVKPPGYDINYVLTRSGSSNALSEAGEVYDPHSGRDLQVFTDQPGVQFYTGNLFDGTLVGKGGVKYTQYCALSIEAQHFPDSPHHANFPSTELRPGEKYEATIEYCFSIRPVPPV
jgi:aldose 1-epimerase